MAPRERMGYGVQTHFAREITEALERQGIKCTVLGRESGHTPDLAEQIFAAEPDCTLSFNGLLPDEHGRFFCDAIQIPHLALLVDSPQEFFPLIHSPLTFITCIDRSFVALFKQLGKKEVFFLPHAVSRAFSCPAIDQERPYPVVFLGTCLDYEERLALWKREFPTGVRIALEEAVEMAREGEVSLIQAFGKTMQRRLQTHGDLEGYQKQYPMLLEQLEIVVRGEERVKLVRSITSAPVHVFGTKSGSKGWDYYLKGASHATFHGKIPYEQALAVMGQAKVVLNSSPHIFDGAHERIFAGLLSGAALCARRTRYLGEFFDNQDLLYFDSHSFQKIDEQILPLLQDEQKRQALVANAQKKVQAHHTWDHRVEALLKQLNP